MPLILVSYIKICYKLALYYYNQHKIKAAETQFITVLKSTFSKNAWLQLDKYDIKTELLDSMDHIGDIYCNNNTYHNNYAKSAAINQFCCKFSNLYHIAFTTKSREIELSFLHSIGINSLTNTLSYQNELEQFRSNIERKFRFLNDDDSRTKQVELLYTDITKFFINNHNTGYIQRLFNECFNELTHIHGEYAIIALGSFSRGTATPWSDLEFAILIDNPKYKQYFRNLTQLFHIKIINLGESQLRWLGIEPLNNFCTNNSFDDWFWDDILPYGLCLDGAHAHACKTPLGRQGYSNPDFELILTPDEMINFQINNKWSESDPYLVQMLRSVSLIYGSQSLLDEYRSKLRNAIDVKILRERMYLIWNTDLNNIKDTVNIKLINVKKDMYRHIDRMIHDLADSYNIITVTTSWNTLDILDTEHIISHMLAIQLKESLSIACELRYRTYYNNINTVNKELIRNYDVHMNSINRFYKTLLKSRNLIQRCYNV